MAPTRTRARRVSRGLLAVGSALCLILSSGDQRSLALEADARFAEDAVGRGHAPGQPEMQEVRIGGTRLAVVSKPPAVIKVYNVPDLPNQAAIDAYVTGRRGALMQLARTQSERIDASVSPSARIPLADFISLAPNHDLRLRDISVDVLVDGRWDSMIWARHGDPGMDFTLSADEIRRQLLAPVLRAGFGPNASPERRAMLSAATMEVRYATGSLEPQQALSLARDSRVELVDPHEDLIAPFRHLASATSVKQMPHVYVYRHLIAKSLYPQTAEQFPKWARDRQANPGKRGTPRPVFACWCATDQNNDDPDGAHKIFAPYSSRHNSSWYDSDAGQPDLVLDDWMLWEDGAPSWFNQRQSDNWAHEITTSHTAYEATTYMVTNLPNIDHNEDSDDTEENFDGFEEREVGTSRPETISAGIDHYMYTEYAPLVDTNTYFAVESEYANWWWYPIDWDLVGRMNVFGTN